MKKPKKVKIVGYPVKAYKYEYNCPHCKVTHIQYGHFHNVSRFYCSECHNELIVDMIVKR